MQSLYGADAGFYVAMCSIPINLITYSYGIMILKGGLHASLKIKDLLTLPLCATLLSIVLFLLHPEYPQFIKDLFSSVSAGTMPISMIAIGASLGEIPLKKAFSEKSLYPAALVRLIIIPVVTWLIVRLITDDPVFLSTCVVIASCPTAVITSVMAMQYAGDEGYVSSCVMVTTLLSMITIPVLVKILC